MHCHSDFFLYTTNQISTTFRFLIVEWLFKTEMVKKKRGITIHFSKIFENHFDNHMRSDSIFSFELCFLISKVNLWYKYNKILFRFLATKIIMYNSNCHFICKDLNVFPYLFQLYKVIEKRIINQENVMWGAPLMLSGIIWID